jgi:hypothetical protein
VLARAIDDETLPGEILRNVSAALKNSRRSVTSARGRVSNE